MFTPVYCPKESNPKPVIIIIPSMKAQWQIFEIHWHAGMGLKRLEF